MDDLVELYAQALDEDARRQGLKLVRAQTDPDVWLYRLVEPSGNAVTEDVPLAGIFGYLQMATKGERKARSRKVKEVVQ